MDTAPSRRAVSPVFGQLYVSVAVLAFAALFVPLYAWGESEYSQGFDPSSAEGYPPLSEIVGVSPFGSIDSYSIWQGIVSYGETVALLAAVLILVFAVLTVGAAARPSSVLAPVLVLVLGIAGLVFLVVEPDRPAGAVTGTGLGMLWGSVIVATVTSAVHLFHAAAGPDA